MPPRGGNGCGPVYISCSVKGDELVLLLEALIGRLGLHVALPPPLNVYVGSVTIDRTSVPDLSQEHPSQWKDFRNQIPRRYLFSPMLDHSRKALKQISLRIADEARGNKSIFWEIIGSASCYF